MKNSNDTIGNRTRDLPDCSAVPQLNVATAYPTQNNVTKINKYVIKSAETKTYGMEVTLSELFNEDVNSYGFVASSCVVGKLFEFYPEICL